MVTPAPTSMTLAPAGDRPGRRPAEPVPVAFVGRTSTLALQDPVASLRRQIRSCQAWLPPAGSSPPCYWDVESGGLDLEARSQGEAWRPFAAAGIPRDGGMADLLAEAASPAAAVRRRGLRGHRTVRAGTPSTRCKLEKELSRAGHPAIRHRRARRHRRRSTPPPSWSAGSSRASRNGSGCS